MISLTPAPRSGTLPHARQENPHRLLGTRSGLTLVEFIVVIAFVGILTTILVPVINKARQAADRAEAAQMMRQLGTTIQIYITDNNGMLPGPTNNNQYAVPMANRKSQLTWIMSNYWDNFHEDVPIPVLGYRSFFAAHDPTLLPTIAISSRTVVSDNPSLRQNAFGKSGVVLPYADVREPHKQVAMIHMDRLAMNDVGTLGASQPEQPLLGEDRIALFFDWRVEFMPLDYRLGTWTTPAQ